jgi:class 3 adenylate cyclase
MDTDRQSRLTAVMFTDIVGYSSMMERDERLTMRLLEEHNAIVLPLIENYGGTVADAIGDGLLVTFQSVFSAGNCAMNIQRAIDGRNRKQEAAKRFLVRIGIHIGDIWFERGRVYGNGVNIAARILPYSLPGGICVSAIVYNQLVSKTEVEAEAVGSKRLKNIQQPVSLYRVTTGCEEPDAAECEEPRTQRFSGVDSFGDRLERRVTERVSSLVGGILDRALDKWEEKPKAERDQAIERLKRSEWFSEQSFVQACEGNKHKGEDGEDDGENEDDPRTLVGVGIAATVGFGVALAYWGAMWLVFPLTLIGLIPLGIGAARLLLPGRGRKTLPAPVREELEGKVLEAASRRSGRLTVMQASVDGRLTIEQAQAVLDEMARKGYVSQEVDQRGVVVYVFPDFLEE